MSSTSSTATVSTAPVPTTTASTNTVSTTTVARVPLENFKQTDRFTDWRRWLNWAVPLVVAVIVASFLLRSDGGQQQLSPRDSLCSAHAVWNVQCQACHEPLSELRPGVLTSLATGSVSNAKCQTCHSGPPHHPAKSDLACAECHRDHRGPTANLKLVGDQQCVGCHSDPGQLLQKPQCNIAFRTWEAHPEFYWTNNEAIKRQDPGMLKFNHGRHLTAGLGVNRTIKQMVAPADQERYKTLQGAESLDALVQLNCKACHVTDSGDMPGNALGVPQAARPPRASGENMLPIVYEQHCQACHPLTFERKSKDSTSSSDPAVTHRLTPDQVVSQIQGYYISELLRGNKELLTELTFTPDRPLPGKRMSEHQAKLDGQIKAAVKELFLGNKTCGECHFNGPVGPSGIPDSIVPTKVKDLWFEKSTFNHNAHRAVNCSHCHENVEKSTSSKDVLLPGKKVCMECHAPATVTAEGPRGGARFDCVECHRYHNGAHPRQGIGAELRAPKDVHKFNGLDFLKGLPPARGK